MMEGIGDRALRTDLPVVLLHNIGPDWTENEIKEAEDDVSTLASSLEEIGHRVTVVPVSDKNLSAQLAPFNPKDVIVFNWCEELPGVPNSEAKVAGILEVMGFAFTGSPADTLALSQDKPAVKDILEPAGVPVPQWAVRDSPEAGDWRLFPAIVKSANGHCSIGISGESVVTTREELERRIGYMLDKFGQPAMVEEYIDGRELLVSVWGNGNLTMLPPVELDYGCLTDIRQKLFSYEAKYDHDSPIYKEIKLSVPAEINELEKAELERIVLSAYRSSGCRDYARIDVRLKDGTFYVLDVNPNPDINPETSLSYSAAEAGFDYGQMGSLFVNFAAARHRCFGRGLSGNP